MSSGARFEVETEKTLIRHGKVFQAGEYPEKQFSLTEAEMAEAVKEFSPVDLDVQHIATPFDGKIGRLKEVYKRGAELFGVFEVPSWLNNLFEGQPMKVSLTWHRHTKRIIGAAFVRNGHVPDAAFAAAFEEQGIPWDHAGGQGDDSHVMSNAPTLTEEDRGFLDTLKALFGGKKEQTGGGASFSEIKAAVSEAVKPMNDRLSALEARFEKGDENDRKTSEGDDDGALAKAAAEFADERIKAGALLPAERAGVIAGFCATAKAGGADWVLFANGSLQECEALTAFKARFGKGHGLDKPAIKPGSAASASEIQFEQDGTVKIDKSAFAQFGRKEGSK
jgi:hypothetical protein